jgi:hypothetical protein
MTLHRSTSVTIGASLTPKGDGDGLATDTVRAHRGR